MVANPPTMRDVAARAGVGPTTVSRVVNGGARVLPETAERVRAAIRELGFQRNEIARALRSSQSAALLALLLGDLTNPFYATIAKSAVDVARRDGYAVVVSTVDEDPETERHVLRDLAGRRVSGLMIVPDQGSHAFLLDELAVRFPVVFVDRPASGLRADVVMVDNEGGGGLATQHLLDGGHRRIATLVAPSYYTTGQRLRGYRRALRDAGHTVDEKLVVRLKQGTPEEAAAATHRLLDLADPPTAIFAMTNFLTEGVLRGLAERGERRAVVGFDDFRLADLLPVPVTVVASDAAELGRHAAQLLLDRISGDTSPARRVVLPVHLIRRGSGELPPS